MATVPIIKPGTRGIDGKADPLTLGTGQLAHAVNLRFEEGQIKTRPGIKYWDLGIQGQFQGATLFCPSLGLSANSFAHSGAQLALAVGGGVYVSGTTSTTVSCQPVKLKGTEEGECDPKDPKCLGDVFLFQAENYLIVQSTTRTTMWWDGVADLVKSPGMVSNEDQDSVTHSHDTFINEKHQNWLVNSANLGIYAHGRVHQEVRNKIYVSDILHKRGQKVTDDILKMEEQSLDSCGEPLNTSSSMGSLLALGLSPQMGTAYGEGVLVAYYQGGVVTYNTHIYPRETKFNGDGTQRLTEGWDTKQLVQKILNTVSAVGRYAVAMLPRDQLFRSPFGVHLLSQVTGTETINDEPINTTSKEVEAILNADDPANIYGTACGYWVRGQRYFVTTGLTTSAPHSSSPSAKGFVSWNKGFHRTAAGTAIPAWEGVWTVDDGMQGIHKFTHIGLRQDEGSFGFIASNKDRELFFGDIQPHARVDHREGQDKPIEWALETGRFSLNGLDATKAITDARLEGVFDASCVKVKILVRTDRNNQWVKWREFSPCERKLKPDQMLLKAEALGKPPEGWREGVWFEFRIEGVGYAEIRSFSVDVTEDKLNSGNSLCAVVDCPKKDYLATSYAPLASA